MKREAATFCLGLWLMGTVCVSVAAMQDFYTIDRLLADPGNDTFAGWSRASAEQNRGIS